MPFRLLRHTLAISCLTLSILSSQSAPETASQHFELGRVHASRGEYDQALAEYKEALRLSPGFLPAHLATAQLLVTRGRFDQAIAETRELLQYDPANLNAKLILSAALMGTHDYRGAHAVLDPLPAQLPRSAEPLFQLGVLALAENKPADAESAFRKSWTIAPSNTRALSGITETYFKRNQPEQAVALLQRELEKQPDNPEILMLAGDTSVRAGKYEIAIQSYQQALKLKAGDQQAEGDIWFRLGETYRRTKDLPAAVAALEKARDRQPGNPSVLQSLALSLDAAAWKSQAIEAYVAVLKIQPENAIALNNLAEALVETDGDLDFALQYAKAAVELLPNLSETKDTLAEVYIKRRMAPEAIAILRDLSARNPERAIIHYHYGLALELAGDNAAALVELRTAQTSKPTPAEAEKITAAIDRLDR